MRFFIILCGLILSVSSVVAQSPSYDLKLSAVNSITEHIDIDTKGGNKGVIAKVQFLESENQVSVSLMSYDQIFSLWDDTHYKKVVRNRKLKVNKLPFATLSNEGAKYKITRSARRDIKDISHRPRRYTMKQTISVAGANAVDTPTKIVNDIIEQRFMLDSDSSNFVTIKLAGMFLFEKSSPKRERYKLFKYYDMSKEWNITINRDYCLGRDQEVEAMRTSISMAKASLNSLGQIVADTTIADSAQKSDLFEKLKTIALEEFTAIEKSDKCAIIENMYGEYNAIIDSIKSLKIDVKVKNDSADYDYIFKRIEYFDVCMSIMQYSDDFAERSDMKELCAEIIREINLYLINCEIIDQQTVRAVETFRSAEQVYFEFVK